MADDNVLKILIEEDDGTPSRPAPRAADYVTNGAMPSPAGAMPPEWREAIDEARTARAGWLDKLKHGAQVAGDVGSDAVRGNTFAALHRLGQEFTRYAGRVDAPRTPIGSVAGGVAGAQPAGSLSALAANAPVAGSALMSLVVSAKKLNDAFLGRAKELEQYSSPVTSAGVSAELRSMAADIRDAQALGPGMARLIDANSRLQVTLQDATRGLKEYLLSALVTPIEAVAEQAKGFNSGMAALGSAAESIQESLGHLLAGDFEGAKKIIDRLVGKATEAAATINAKEDADADAVFDSLLRDIPDLPERDDPVLDGDNLRRGQINPFDF